MTAKELHKLSRQDLLQLLLAQSREVARQKENIDELKGLLKKERELSTRLKEKLNEKDELFERLKHRLDEKDGELSVAQEEAETMRQSMESLRSRLDEKDIALESARARLDRIGPETSVRQEVPRIRQEAPVSYQSPLPVESRQETRPAAPAPRRRDEGEDRRRYLQELLARREAQANELRKP